jgi:hypothetical protein
MRAKIRAAACLSREAEGFVLELHPPHPITRAHLGRGSSASGTALSAQQRQPEADLKYKSITAFLSSTTL